jgi:urea transporter
MNGQSEPKPRLDLRVARILWGALFFSTLLYIVVLELTEVQSEADWESLATMFAFGAAGAAGASLLAPRFVRRSTGAYIISLVLALALAESVCILGLVLGFLGAPPTVVMPFFFVTWVLMVIRFPTKEKMAAFDS